MESELFEIKLNDNGAKLFARLSFWIKVFYIFAIVTSIFDLINSYFIYSAYRRFMSSWPPILKFETAANMISIVVYAILLPVTAYFFYLFIVRSRRAIRYGSSEEFNAAFGWLLKHAVFSAILFVINSAWSVMITYCEIKIQSMYHI